MVIDDGLPLFENVRPDDAIHDHGLMRDQGLVDMHQVEEHDSEFFPFPGSNLHLVPGGDLGLHAHGPCPGGLYLALLGDELKMSSPVQPHTAVGGPGVQDELPVYAVDLGIEFKMVCPCKYQGDMYIIFGFEELFKG